MFFFNSLLFCGEPSIAQVFENWHLVFSVILSAEAVLLCFLTSLIGTNRTFYVSSLPWRLISGIWKIYLTSYRVCASSAPRFGIFWTSISNIKLVTGMNMNRSSPVSSDTSWRATSNQFPLPSAWLPGCNHRFSFLWWSRTVDLRSGVTSHAEPVRCPSRQLLSRLLGWASINLKVWRFAISSVWSNVLCALIH